MKEARDFVASTELEQKMKLDDHLPSLSKF
jgi:hypothetical protein